MYCELPEFHRCCFCLPLRRGILILAYLNILCSIVETVLSVGAIGVISIHRSYSMLPLELDITLFILDALATIAFIVGLHMKRELIVRLYYNFLIFSISASVPLTIIDCSLMNYAHHVAFNIFYFVFTLVLNFYLLLLVRSLVKKLQVSDNNTFGNQLAEFIEGTPAEPSQNQVTITIRDDHASSDKTVPQ